MMILLSIIALGYCALGWWRYHYDTALQMILMGPAVGAYHRQYGVLPPSIRALQDSKIYGLGATRLPGHWWEGWNEHTGPEVFYLPVEHWDGKTEYVIAVQPPTSRKERGYLVTCEYPAKLLRASETGLEEILARDDELRASTGQPARWSQIAWRPPTASQPAAPTTRSADRRPEPPQYSRAATRCSATTTVATSQSGVREIRVDANYPGGNIIVDKIENDVVYLRPDPRDTEGWWFYWNFRVRGAAGRTQVFRFNEPSPIGVRGPAVRANREASWQWLGSQAVEGASFRYAFGPSADDMRFCFAIPYQEADLRQFLAGHATDKSLRVETLCKTRKGRDVERLHVGMLDGEPKHRVLVTCRHHACEMMANWCLEGLIEAILADTADGAWLRQNVEFAAIPFMDKDGVQDGDQGKNRRPHDHNRDYAGESLYPEVQALRGWTPQWSQSRLRVAIDLHDPHIRGPHNEVIYQVGRPEPAIWAEQRAFGGILQAARIGPLVYRAADDLPFGQGWNKTQNFASGKSFAAWAAEQPGIRLATSIEVPYAEVSGVEVTPETARAFGRDLAGAIREYLR